MNKEGMLMTESDERGLLRHFAISFRVCLCASVCVVKENNFKLKCIYT